MTLQGAIQQLHEMRSADNFPFYYKPAIDKVIETLKMDVQEVKYGTWIDMGDFEQCSECHGTHLKEFQTYYGKVVWIKTSYCPNCGVKMNSKE